MGIDRRLGQCCVRGEGGEVVREEQGLEGSFYRAEREGEGRSEAVGGAPSAATIVICIP
jgi:hypothetical protein